MSYYALFKGWLLLSQPPSCLCISHPFPLNGHLGALAGGLGSFPFDHGPYHPQSDSRLYLSGIRSLIEISTPRWGHHPFSALPPVDLTSRLALKLFRREPAISVFDWNFTPSHKSSKHFSTCPGSALQSVLPDLQPAHG